MPVGRWHVLCSLGSTVEHADSEPSNSKTRLRPQKPVMPMPMAVILYARTERVVIIRLNRNYGPKLLADLAKQVTAEFDL